MKLYFDIDKKLLVNSPGTGGAVRSVSFIRGDIDPLEVRFLKAGVEVADVTDIVAVVKKTPGEGVAILAQCMAWQLADTVFSGEINLNGADLNTMIGDKLSISLIFELSCFHAGRGQITAQPVLCTLTNDLWRGTEGTPLELPTPDEWLDDRRPPVLTGAAAPVDQVLGVSQVETATVVAPAGVTASGTYTVTITGSGITGSPLGIPVALTLAAHTTADLIASAIATALAGVSRVTEFYTPSSAAGDVILTRVAPAANDTTLNIALPAALGITAAPTSANTTAGVATTGTAGKIGQRYRAGVSAPYAWYDCVTETPSTWQISDDDSAYVPNARTVAGHPLSADVAITHSDVGAQERTVFSLTAPTGPLAASSVFVCGDGSQIRVEAKVAGVAGNSIVIDAHTIGSGSRSVTVVGDLITVLWPEPTTTAANIVNWINFDFVAAALVTASVVAEGGAIASTGGALSGGFDGTPGTLGKNIIVGQSPNHTVYRMVSDSPIAWDEVKPSVATLDSAKTYADSLVIGLVDDRGNFDATVNTFPTTGGSGTGGAIKKGDLWIISVAATAGALNGYAVGTQIRALSDAPGQTSGNWAITQSGLNYVPENSANKSTSVTTDQDSDTKFPTVKSVYDWSVGAFAGLTHKSRHATGGADALSPADIGAATPTDLAARAYPAPGNIWLKNVEAKLAARGAGGLYPPVHLFIGGDSIASGYETAPLFIDQQIVGYKIAPWYVVTAGTVTAHNAGGLLDPTKWINGIYYDAMVGSTSEWYFNGTTALRANMIGVAYLQGTGSFDFQYSIDGGTWTTVATIDTSLATGADFKQYAFSNPYNLTVKARITNVTTSHVEIIGAGYWLNNSGGVVQSICSLSGISPTTVLQTGTNIIEGVIAGAKPDMVLSSWNDPASNWDEGGNFDTIVSRFNAGYAAIDWLLVSGNPFNPAGVNGDGEALSLAQRDGQRSWALRNRRAFIDGYSMFRSYAEAVSEGHMTAGDDYHLTAKGRDFRNRVIREVIARSMSAKGGTLLRINDQVALKHSGYANDKVELGPLDTSETNPCAGLFIRGGNTGAGVDFGSRSSGKGNEKISAYCTGTGDAGTLGFHLYYPNYASSFIGWQVAGTTTAGRLTQSSSWPFAIRFKKSTGSDPVNTAAGNFDLFGRLNGSGKMEICAVFPSGATRVIETESGGSTTTRSGNATLTAGTVTVTNSSVTSDTLITITRKTAGGTLGNLTYTVTAGTSFTIDSDNIADTSTVTYILTEAK